MENLESRTASAGTIETGRPTTYTAGNFTVNNIVELELMPSAGDKETIKFVKRSPDPSMIRRLNQC